MIFQLENKELKEVSTIFVVIHQLMGLCGQWVQF